MRVLDEEITKPMNRVFSSFSVVSCSAPPNLRREVASAMWSVCMDENEEETRTFLEGINRDAPGLGLGGRLSFFFGRGSGGTGKPFGFGINFPFVCGGGVGPSVLAVGAVMVAVAFVPCSDIELVEATRLIGDFITSLGLISSRSWGSVTFRGSGVTGATFGFAMGVGRTRLDGDVKYEIVACTSVSHLHAIRETLRLTSTIRWRERAS